jgi:hypothetical protein
MMRIQAMGIPSNSSGQPVDDSGPFAILMPNRGRARFLRGAILIFVAGGAFGCITVCFRVWAEFHARHSWPVARGEVTFAEIRTNKNLPGNLNRRTTFWVEYGVRFAIPAEQCTIWTDPGELGACGGIARTRSTDSSAIANAWLMRHPRNSAVEALHNPRGPEVKIAGESAWLVYPWKSIFGMAAWMAFFLTFLNIIQRRLQYLGTLPEDYDASPPSSSQSPGRDDLVDLKIP